MRKQLDEQKGTVRHNRFRQYTVLFVQESHVIRKNISVLFTSEGEVLFCVRRSVQWTRCLIYFAVFDN